MADSRPTLGQMLAQAGPRPTPSAFQAQSQAVKTAAAHLAKDPHFKQCNGQQRCRQIQAHIRRSKSR